MQCRLCFVAMFKGSRSPSIFRPVHESLKNFVCGNDSTSKQIRKRCTKLMNVRVTRLYCIVCMYMFIYQCRCFCLHSWHYCPKPLANVSDILLPECIVAYKLWNRLTWNGAPHWAQGWMWRCVCVLPYAWRVVPFQVSLFHVLATVRKFAKATPLTLHRSSKVESVS